jgi:hypothetical protein
MLPGLRLAHAALVTVAHRRSIWAPRRGVEHVLVCILILICSLAVVTCPTNAAGAPLCACNSGFIGALSFSTGTQTWSGTCSRTPDSLVFYLHNPVVTCPANAAGAPVCSCNSGYTGTLTFGGGVWSGSCSCYFLYFMLFAYQQWSLVLPTLLVPQCVRAALASVAHSHSTWEHALGLERALVSL